MKKINWNNVLLLAVLGITVFLFLFSEKRNESRKIASADILFTENENFITHDKIYKILTENYNKVTELSKEKLNLDKLEKQLNSNPMIDKSEVFTTVNGKLKAIIRQRKPIARVYESDSSYYIDYKGNKMPLSDTYTARVPLVTGEVDKITPKKLHEVLQYIYDDGFLKKNITGLEIRPTGGIIMTNRNYDYDILFGRVVNMEKKFNNYKAFFQNAVKDTLIKNYNTINLKFTQQVVCTKN